MAASSDDGIPADLRLVWTLIIRGGEPFDIRVNGKLGPGLSHDGTLTIWKMVGTAGEALSIAEMIEGPLIGARVERHTEVENEEMLAIRRQHLGLED